MGKEARALPFPPGNLLANTSLFLACPSLPRVKSTTSPSTAHQLLQQVTGEKEVCVVYMLRSEGLHGLVPVNSLKTPFTFSSVS